MRKQSLFSWIIIAAFAFSASGCGESFAKVSGKVTLDGTAVDGGIVSFMSESGAIATATIQPDGQYEALNVPNGPVKVTVYPPQGVSAETSGEDIKKGKQPAPKSSEKSVIPERYTNFDTSGLAVDVKGKEFKYDVPLTR